MTKYLIAAIVALTLALGGALWWARHEAQNAAYATLQAQDAKAQAEAAQARLQRVQKQVKAADDRADLAVQELRNALDKNRSWADSRVPDDVAGSLCKYARCDPSRADSVPPTSH